jgi:hypothetical protein
VINSLGVSEKFGELQLRKVWRIAASRNIIDLGRICFLSRLTSEQPPRDPQWSFLLGNKIGTASAQWSSLLKSAKFARAAAQDCGVAVFLVKDIDRPRLRRLRSTFRVLAASGPLCSSSATFFALKKASRTVAARDVAAHFVRGQKLETQSF